MASFFWRAEAVRAFFGILITGFYQTKTQVVASGRTGGRDRPVKKIRAA